MAPLTPSAMESPRKSRKRRRNQPPPEANARDHPLFTEITTRPEGIRMIRGIDYIILRVPDMEVVVKEEPVSESEVCARCAPAHSTVTAGGHPSRL